MSELLEFLSGTRDFFHGNHFFAFGVLLLCGYFGGRLAQKLKLPTISGYVVAGLLLGPSVFNVVPDKIDVYLKPIPYVALALIALAIGSQLRFSTLKSLGAGIAIITLIQLLVTFACVTIVTSLFGLPFKVALLLGAIGSATAPAATVAVLSEFRARGPLTTTLLAVVALDDAGCVMLFGIASSIGAAISPGAHVRIGHMLLAPLAEIFGAIALGGAVGPLLHLLVRRRREPRDVLIIALGTVLFCSGAAMELNLSPLIANMMVGFMLINISGRNARVLRIIEPIESPIYAAFFAIAGTELDLGALRRCGAVGAAYVGSRALGKLLGASLGAMLGKASPVVRRYLGLALLPQAGVAIGLSLLAGETQWLIETQSTGIVSIVLAGVVVNELVGPPCAKLAIVRAGETHVTQARGKSEESEAAEPPDSF